MAASGGKWVGPGAIILGVWILAGLASPAQTGFEEKGPPAAPNLLLITAESLRPDYLSCYGREGAPSTPNIDSLARGGHLFEQVLASSPSSVPSVATLLTGRYPFEHQVWDDFYRNRLGSDSETLAERLRKEGYRTAAFLATTRLSVDRGLDQGLGLYQDGFPPTPNGVWRLGQRTGRSVVPAAVSWMKGGLAEPFFLWVHLIEPAVPGRTTMRDPDPKPQETYRQRVEELDMQVGVLLEALRELELESNTVVALTADHGQGLGQHGEARSGIFLYDTTLRVPLLLRLTSPEAEAERTKIARHSELAGLVDLVPTLLPLLGIAADPTLPGRDLLVGRGERGGGEPAESIGYHAVALMGREAFGWAPLEMVARGPLRLILGPTSELYDLSRDPDQKENLASRHKKVVKELGELRDTLAGGAAIPPPHFMPDAKIPQSLSDRLRKLGYVGPDREAAEARALPDPARQRTALPVLEETYLRTQLTGALIAAPVQDRLQNEAAGSLFTLLTLPELAFAAGMFDAEAAAGTGEILKLAQRQFPMEAEVYHRLGHRAFLMKEIEQAELFLEVAVLLVPHSPAEVLYDLACANSLGGKQTLALDRLRRSIRLGFRDFAHIASDPDLVALRSDPGYQSLMEEEFPAETSR